MKFYLACIVAISVFNVAKGTNPSLSTEGPQTLNSTVQPNPEKSGNTSTIMPVTPSSSNKPSKSLTSVIHSSSIYYTHSYVQTSHINPNKTRHVNPNMTSHVNPNMTSHINPNMTSHINPNMTGSVNHTAAQISSNGTVTLSTRPPHSQSVAPTGKPTKSSGKGDDKDYDNMKKRMWIAGSFAIIFAITTVILAYLFYRQRRINRELDGDPATSRLL